MPELVEGHPVDVPRAGPLQVGVQIDRSPDVVVADDERLGESLRRRGVVGPVELDQHRLMRAARTLRPSVGRIAAERRRASRCRGEFPCRQVHGPDLTAARIAGVDAVLEAVTAPGDAGIAQGEAAGRNNQGKERCGQQQPSPGRERRAHRAMVRFEAGPAQRQRTRTPGTCTADRPGRCSWVTRPEIPERGCQPPESPRR